MLLCSLKFVLTHLLISDGFRYPIIEFLALENIPKNGFISYDWKVPKVLQKKLPKPESQFLGT